MLSRSGAKTKPCTAAPIRSGMRRDSPMSPSPQFSSECPKCGHERLLTGYAREELVELLSAGAEIEGYCISCDERWSIPTDERADLARALSRPS